jgi:hypothetical protein
VSCAIGVRTEVVEFLWRMSEGRFGLGRQACDVHSGWVQHEGGRERKRVAGEWPWRGEREKKARRRIKLRAGGRRRISALGIEHTTSVCQGPPASESREPCRASHPCRRGPIAADLALYLATPPAAKDEDDETLAAAAAATPMLTNFGRDHRNTIASSRPAGPCCGDTWHDMLDLTFTCAGATHLCSHATLSVQSAPRAARRIPVNLLLLAVLESGVYLRGIPLVCHCWISWSREFIHEVSGTLHICDNSVNTISVHDSPEGARYPRDRNLSRRYLVWLIAHA